MAARAPAGESSPSDGGRRSLECVECGYIAESPGAVCSECGAELPVCASDPDMIRASGTTPTGGTAAPPMPRPGLGVISITLCGLGAFATAGLFLLFAYSLPVLYEGSDFDDPEFAADVDLLFWLLIAAGVLAVVAAIVVYMFPRLGAIFALCGTATGAVAVLAWADWHLQAIVLWVPAGLPLSAAALVAILRDRHIRALRLPT